MCLKAAPVVIPALFCIVFYTISDNLNRFAVEDRLSANSLTVLSGILAALAILLPLGTALIPDHGHFTWQIWFLIGALLAGTGCLFGTVYCMIGLQDAVSFKPKDKRYIPGWINASWIALGMLALATVLLKIST